MPNKRKKRFIKTSNKRIRTTIAPSIQNLKSLIEISKKGTYYTNINMPMLWKIFPQLVLLDAMVGMESLKQTIFYQIIYYLQKLNWNTPNEYLHTVLLGPPGCGKTTIAQIIGELYSNLGILSNKKIFKIAKREDFIAKYLGQTDKKTQKLLKECIGGVLFIDEAYALGSGQTDKDSFSKEAIDTINAFLSEHKDFCCIIAGYEEEIKKCFFSVNRGLERRFPWVHHIEKYSSEDLARILIKMVSEIDWQINVDITKISRIIASNIGLFCNFGGDVETFVSKCKMAHAKRVFNLDIKHKFILIEKDLLEGISLMKEHRINQESVDKNHQLMYL